MSTREKRERIKKALKYIEDYARKGTGEVEEIRNIALFISTSVFNCSKCPANHTIGCDGSECEETMFKYLNGEQTMKFGKYEIEERLNTAVGGLQYLISFKNGYQGNVISSKYAHTDKEHPYELAVLKNGHICYDTPITHDVIGHLTADEVGEILAKIEALPDA